MFEIIINIIFIIFIGFGILFSLIPFMPSILFMFVLSLVYALINGFSDLVMSEIAILGIVLIISILVDLFSGIIGAKYGGATKNGIFYGLVGLVLGFIIFPPLGSFLGLFLGVLLAEILGGRGEKRALRAAFGSLAGSFAGVAVNLFLAIIFFVLFIYFVYFHQAEEPVFREVILSLYNNLLA